MGVNHPLVERLLAETDPAARDRLMGDHAAELDASFAAALKARADDLLRADSAASLAAARLLMRAGEVAGQPPYRALGLLAEANVLCIGQGEYARALALYDEAAAVYRALGADPASPVAGASRHNLGNSLYQKQDYKGAIQAYRDALRVAPGAEDTRRNLELALRALQEQEEQQKRQKEQDEKQQQEKSQQKKDQQGDQRRTNSSRRTSRKTRKASRTRSSRRAPRDRRRPRRRPTSASSRRPGCRRSGRCSCSTPCSRTRRPSRRSSWP
jgi:tetratricopeptide (TPR) repeat protein